MQIGIVAKKIGLSVDAIRFYERNALLSRPPRTQGIFASTADRSQAPVLNMIDLKNVFAVLGLMSICSGSAGNGESVPQLR